MVTIEKRITFKGVTPAAKLLKTTPQHLSRVLSGERESGRITREMKRLGITVKEVEKQAV